MNSQNKLTLHERAEIIRKLMCGREEHLGYIFAAARRCYHDLNAIAYSLFKKYGIEHHSSDFEFSKKANHLLFELRNKFESENKIDGKTTGLAYDCFRLAKYFLLLGDYINVVEKATDWEKNESKPINQKAE